jgi:polysaccharide chain length determinant protein (PEP-CTERM system associated)
VESENAQKFLQDQIRQYESRLTTAENRLADFKRENVKFMPDQTGDYFSRLQSAETALQATIGKLNVATQRRAELERQIEGEEPVFGIMTSTSSSSSAGGPTSAKLRELEQQLAELRLQYTDKHPRIGQILDTIDMLEKQAASEARDRAAAASARPLEQNPLDLNPVYQTMRIQLSSVVVEIASLRAEQSQEQQEVARLRTMVDTIPQVEAELKRLNRDYEVVAAKHRQLVQQLETATIGDDASRTMDDVQFRIIEPPFSDETPVGPNRPFLLFAVLVIAVGFGGLSAMVRNQLDPVFIGNRSVLDALGIPVLASVSLIQSKAELRSERRGRRAVQTAAASLLIVFVAITAYSGPGSIIFRNFISSAP